MRILCDWKSEKELMDIEMEYELVRIKTVSEFLSRTDLRDKTFKTIYREYKQQFMGLSGGITRFRNEARLLGYNYKVSQRQFRRGVNHSLTAFKAFESIVRTLNQSPNSVLFFDVSTFAFEVNPRRAWQSKQRPAFFYSSTNYKRYHILLSANVSGVFAYQVVLGRVHSETILEFLFRCQQKLRSNSANTQCCIVLDNATIHKTARMKRMVAATDITFLFTASHCPYMNPVEECFRFLKSKYRNKHRINEFIN